MCSLPGQRAKYFLPVIIQVDEYSIYAINYKESKMYQIGFYETVPGKSPVLEFLGEMSGKARAKFAQIAILLEEKGPEVQMPYSRHLEDGIFEVRVIVGKDSSRVLYFFLEGKRIIFTNGFKKKTQKTPRREIETAMRYRAEYVKGIRR